MELKEDKNFDTPDIPGDQNQVVLMSHFNRMIDRITTYAEDLPGEDYASAKVIQRMMLNLYARMCSNEQFARIKRIPGNVASKLKWPAHGLCLQGNMNVSESILSIKGDVVEPGGTKIIQ